MSHAGYSYYTIPRNNRELQPSFSNSVANTDYTIPRNNRELQPDTGIAFCIDYYTIPRNNRELQRLFASIFAYTIIPYQEIIGNYSDSK